MRPPYQICFCFLSLGIVACASQEAGRRANDDVGPVSAYARNNLAENNPLGLVKVGEGFEQAGDYAGAYALYQQALAAAPTLLEARIAVARILTPLGKPQQGIAELSALVNEVPHSEDVRLALTDAFIAVGDYARAATTFSPIVESSNTPAAFDMAGRLAYVGGDSEAARQYFDRALALDTSAPTTLRHLALSYAMEGQFESAVALLRKAMDRPDGQLAAQRSLALIYALSGQTEAAMHIARSAMSADEARGLQTFYALLPKLNKREQAEALLFDRIPKESISRIRGS